MPLLHREHNAEVAARDVVAVDVAGFGRRALIRREMGDDLVTVEIEVHPVRAGAPFSAAEEVEIKRAAGVEVVGGEGEVEGLDGHGLLCAGFAIAPCRSGDPSTGSERTVGRDRVMGG